MIKIDEDTYKDIKNGKVYSSIRDVPQESVLAIANGTVLPKGHGRLIDANAINIHDISPVYEMEVYGVKQDDIEYEPTIIEEDNEKRS